MNPDTYQPILPLALQCATWALDDLTWVIDNDCPQHQVERAMSNAVDCIGKLIKLES